MSISLGLIDWAIDLVVLSSSILFGLYLAVRKKSSADSMLFFWAAAVGPGLWSARHCLPPTSRNLRLVLAAEGPDGNDSCSIGGAGRHDGEPWFFGETFGSRTWRRQRWVICAAAAGTEEMIATDSRTGVG
jgi:hypothetical protein